MTRRSGSGRRIAGMRTVKTGPGECMSGEAYSTSPASAAYCAIPSGSKNAAASRQSTDVTSAPNCSASRSSFSPSQTYSPASRRASADFASARRCRIY